MHTFRSVQSLSHVRLLATPWTAARQASQSITNSQSLLKLRPPALGAQSLSHWTTREVPIAHYF